MLYCKIGFASQFFGTLLNEPDVVLRSVPIDEMIQIIPTPTSTAIMMILVLDIGLFSLSPIGKYAVVCGGGNPI